MSLFSNLSEHVDPSPNTLDRSTVTGTPDYSSLRPRRRRQAPRAEDPPHRHRCVGAAPGGGGEENSRCFSLEEDDGEKMERSLFDDRKDKNGDRDRLFRRCLLFVIQFTVDKSGRDG